MAVRRRSRNNNNSMMMVGIGIAVVALCALAFYFFYWVRTPNYAVKSIRKSIATHNAATFVKYVDLDTVYGLAFKKIIYSSSGVNPSDNIFGAIAIDNMKDDTVTFLKEFTIYTIARKDLDNIDELEDKRLEVDKVLGNYVNTIAKGIKQNFDIKDMTVTRVDGDRAQVEILVYNNAKSRNFKVLMTMSNRNTSYWRIKRIDNVEEVLNNL